MQISISEIIAKAAGFKKKEEKIEWLKKNSSEPLRTILKLTYDTDNIKFLLPDSTPPWKKNDYIDVQGMLYKEARRLKLFVKGFGYDDLDQVKREQLFITLLEDIDNDDAELLCKMIKQKPIKGLPLDVVVSAFPEDYPTIKNQENKTHG